MFHIFSGPGLAWNAEPVVGLVMWIEKMENGVAIIHSPGRAHTRKLCIKICMIFYIIIIEKLATIFKKQSTMRTITQVCKKNVQFVLEQIGVISKVVFPVESKSGLRTAPARQVFE